MSERLLDYDPTISSNREAINRTLLSSFPAAQQAAVGNRPFGRVEPNDSFPRLFQFLRMSNRVSALSTILRSPMRILGLVLMLVFCGEVAVMFVLPYVLPGMLSQAGKAVVDAVLLTLVCAPAVWLVIIGPLRRIAVQEHNRSETIVANASESILTLDDDGRVLSCNRAAREMFGLDVESLLACSIHSLVPSFPAIPSQLPIEFRVDARRASGESFPIQVSVSQYASESGKTLIAIVHDLTETEKAEQERLLMARATEALRAQQMTTLAQLATGVAHEIRNPLTSIKMLIQVNRAKFADEGLPTDDLELVEQEIRRMERSVNSLLDYARPETSEFKRFAIQEPVRRIAKLIEGRCQTQKVDLQVDVPEGDVLVYGDAAQIQQLLLNLGLNALDAMPDEGTLRLTVAEYDGEAIVSVVDTGVGIDETVLGKLFDPFVTAKANGVGLGLGICRRIAETHEGRLTGNNQIMGGAKFQLALPVVTEAGSGEAAQSATTPESLDGYS